MRTTDCLGRGGIPEVHVLQKMGGAAVKVGFWKVQKGEPNDDILETPLRYTCF